MKTIEIKLEKDEKRLVNNVLLENCMSLTDLLREQKTQKGAESIVQIIQASMGCQQSFFAACLEEKLEIPEAMGQFIKPILEGAHESLAGIKEKLIKSGDRDGFVVASTVEILANIINKFPNPSVIISS
jgi:hypothetical protein